MQLKKISIIIVTYNSEHHIFDCIASIYRYNDIGDALELIVVDNNSNHVDDMFSVIEKQFGKEIILISNKINGGYGQGNNIGIRKASGSVILIMNPDVRLVQPIFAKALAHFEKTKVVMLGMIQMVSPDKRGLSFISKFSKYPIWEILETIISNKLLCYNYRRMFFSGACFFIRKSTFKEIGFFDEKIFMYGEENDIHNRLLMQKPDSLFVFDKNIKYMHLVDRRMPTVNSIMQTMDSVIRFYVVHQGMDRDTATRNQINYQIKRAKFLKFIRTLKRDKKYVLFYNQLLLALNERLKNIN